MPAFPMQLAGFSAGSKLDIVNGSFRGIGFGGRAKVVKFEPDALELDLRVTKLLFHIDVVLRFHTLPDGTLSFFGGRPDGKTTGREPAHVQHTMTVKSQTPDRTVFEFEMLEKGVNVVKQVSLEKRRTQKGNDSLHLTYERIEMTLAPTSH
ncbi:MAG: hypothetical protein JNK82_43925 [Myxococcaceae bacterium]|nr:hypothetical protein [Myxococcaceae bacterium]